MNRFAQKLAEHSLTLSRDRLVMLQLNIGRKCNQVCRHCHIDAAPWRTEMIDEATAHRIGAWMATHRREIVDLTGGAPELSVGHRGEVHDCDFNQMLGIQMHDGALAE